MSKRKTQSEEDSAASHAGTPSLGNKAKRTRKVHDADIQEVDLRGMEFATPVELQDYLKEHYPIPKTGLCCWSVKTDSFPRGCMQILLDHVSKSKQTIRIVQFHQEYGKVSKYQLQNPDLKLLLKTHGPWLTHLSLIPQEESRPPKLQGCGYRWTTLHAKSLKVLGISLQYDIKRQLLDLSRKTPLRLQCLEELVIRDVGSNTTKKHLEALVAKAPNLRRLSVYEPSFETNAESLVSFLEQSAQRAGNDKLSVEVHL